MERFEITRRQLLHGAGALALGAALPDRVFAGTAAPSAPVSMAGCDSYELPLVLKRLDTMFDQIGGIQKLVNGKTVAIKVNLVNTPSLGVLGLPSNRTYHVHPNVALATATLLDRAGAKRIRFLESTFSKAPIEQFFLDGGWDLRAFQALSAMVEFEDTRNKGKGSGYQRLKVPGGGSLFTAYDLNHSYVDCDVYVSIAKLKNHLAAGVTLSMKNNFGITPTSLYSHSEASEDHVDARVNVIHDGSEKPPAGVPGEVDPASPRKVTYRVPRHIVDAVGIRPIHLAIIDGIESVSGGEGPWQSGLARQRPHVLLAGRNPVCTDAIATSVMGYNPMAKAGTETFPGDNHLALAAALGLGTNDPKQIETIGLAMKDALHPFNWEPRQRGY